MKYYSAFLKKMVVYNNKDTMLSGISQTQKTNTATFHLYVECKNVKLVEIETGMGVSRSRGMGELRRYDQRVPTFSYKMINIWIPNGDYS